MKGYPNSYNGPPSTVAGAPNSYNGPGAPTGPHPPGGMPPPVSNASSQPYPGGYPNGPPQQPATSTGGNTSYSAVPNSAQSPVGNSSTSDGVPVHDDTSQQSTLSQSSDRSDGGGGGGRQTPKSSSGQQQQGFLGQGYPHPGKHFDFGNSLLMRFGWNLHGVLVLLRNVLTSSS